MTYREGTCSANSYIYFDAQHFKVSRVNLPPHEGEYIITLNNQYLTMRANGTVYMTSTLSDYSYWRINYYDIDNQAQMYDFIYSGTDTTETAPTFTEKMIEIGYNPTVNENSPYTDLHNALLNREADIVVFRGHAGPATLQFGIPGEHIFYKVSRPESSPYYTIEDLPENSLYNVKMMLLLGCSSGRTNQNGENLLDAFYDKGAHFVLGTYDNVYTSDGNKFLKEFLNAIDIGYSIQGAIEYAHSINSDVYLPSYGYYTEYPVVYKGDANQIIN